MSPCPDLHIPHKEWSGQDELENYHAIEEWARTRTCGGSCFLQHKTKDALAVPLNTYTSVASWDTTVTCGTRPISPTATTILLCEWHLVIQDYSDDATAPNPAVRFGYGVFCTQNSIWIGGSHGFIEWQHALDNPWQAGIANLPAGLEWPDALTSGSFAVPLNVAQPSASFDIAAVLGIYNPAAATDATFHIETYEYALSGCECQE